MTMPSTSGDDQLRQKVNGVRRLRVMPKERIMVSREILKKKGQTRIDELANRLYERRGRQNGYALIDWLEAERQALTQDPR